MRAGPRLITFAVLASFCAGAAAASVIRRRVRRVRDEPTIEWRRVPNFKA